MGISWLLPGINIHHVRYEGPMLFIPSQNKALLIIDVKF